MTLLYVYHRAITLFKVHCCQYLFWLFKVALCCFHILHYIMHFLCNQCVFSLHRNCMAGNKIRKAAPAAAAVAYCKIRPERPFFPTSSILPPISPQSPLSSSPSPLSPSFCVLSHYGWFLHNLAEKYWVFLYSNSAIFWFKHVYNMFYFLFPTKRIIISWFWVIGLFINDKKAYLVWTKNLKFRTQCA